MGRLRWRSNYKVSSYRCTLSSSRQKKKKLFFSALGGTVTSISGEPTIDFGPGDSTILEHGLLATMDDHKWYLDKFYNL